MAIMNASELNRKLLYCGYDDMADYLRDSPLNRFIYQQMLFVRQQYNIDIPILTLFNEVYYQCVHIQNDRTPGEDIEKRFLEEEQSYLGSRDEAMLVFAIVRAFYLRKKKLIFEEQCFWEQFWPLIKDNHFSTVTDKILDFMKKARYKVPQRFQIMHFSFSEMPMDSFGIGYLDMAFEFVFRSKEEAVATKEYSRSFADITDNFSPVAIRWLVGLYSSREDKIKILNTIENVCPSYWRRKHNLDFRKLRFELNIVKEDKETDEPVRQKESPELNRTERKDDAKYSQDIEQLNDLLGQHHTININTVHQMNINPQVVNNNVKE